MHRTKTVLLTAGIGYFDTSPWYGNGKSELRFGHVLRTKPRNSFVLSTKVGIRMSQVQNDVGTGRKHLMAALDGPRAHLKAPCLQ